MIGLPNAILAVFLHFFLHTDEHLDDHQMVGVPILWSSCTFLLGFMLVFRNNQSFSRFWEGATLIHQIRGEWFNAVSNLIAFCNQDVTKKKEVQHFQHLLIRLSSMLYCCALQQVCELSDDTMEIIDVSNMDKDSLAFLLNANDRCEILMQWIQRLIADGHVDGAIITAPPILSRVYQELSRGIVNLNNVRKIEQVPFPLPYAQILMWMLVVHWGVTPLLASYVVHTPWWAGFLCFVTVVGMWSVMFIAVELDQPFGADHNDLNVAEMQRDFNLSLIQLLHPLAQRPPIYLHMDDNETPLLVDSTAGFPSLRRPIDPTHLNKKGSLRGSVIVRGSAESQRAKEQASAAAANANATWNHNVNAPQSASEVSLPEADAFFKADDVGVGQRNPNVNANILAPLPCHRSEVSLPENDPFLKADDVGVGDLLDRPPLPDSADGKPKMGTSTYLTASGASGNTVQEAVKLEHF